MVQTAEDAFDFSALPAESPAPRGEQCGRRLSSLSTPADDANPYAPPPLGDLESPPPDFLPAEIQRLQRLVSHAIRLSLINTGLSILFIIGLNMMPRKLLRLHMESYFVLFTTLLVVTGLWTAWYVFRIGRKLKWSILWSAIHGFFAAWPVACLAIALDIKTEVDKIVERSNASETEY